VLNVDVSTSLITSFNVIVNKQLRWAINLRTRPILTITDWKSAVDYYANILGLIKN
jgi:hypothetical protein